MSIEAVNFAYKSDCPHRYKLVFMAIATYCNKDSGLAWPSVGNVAKHLGIKKRTAEFHFQWLRDNGYIQLVEERYRDDGSRSSNVYKITGVDSEKMNVCTAGTEHTIGRGTEHTFGPKRTSILEREYNIIDPPEKVSSDTTYRWQGKIIKINESDFDLWRKNYRLPVEIMEAELQACDTWLVANKKPDGWYMRASSWLARESKRRAEERDRERRAARDF